MAIVVVLVLGAAALVLIWPWLSRPSIETLAVLPFANTAADPNAQYLDDGITDAMIGSLSGLPGMRVRPRDSVAGYKKKTVTAQAAGRDLGVQAVLKGSYLQKGDDLIVTAELVDVRNNAHLWGGRFDRKLTDMQALEEEMASQISVRLRSGMTVDARKKLTRRPTDNPEAYQLYLRGRYLWENRNEERLKKSLECFSQAIDKDPSFARAYTGLAAAYAVSSSYSFLSPRESIPRSKAAAKRALEIDDSIAQAHTVLAWGLWSYDWNFHAAEEEFKKGSTLDPEDATAHHWYGLMLVSAGRTEEAVAHLRRALEIDPFSPVIQMNLARAFLYSRQYERAIAEARKLPDFPLAHVRIADSLLARNDVPGAAAEYGKAAKLSGPNSQGIWFAAQGEALVGNHKEATKAFDAMIALGQKKYFQPAYVASVYLRLSDREHALEWLEKSYDDHSFDLVFLRVNPGWDPLRSEPRFRSLLERLALPGR